MLADFQAAGACGGLKVPPAWIVRWLVYSSVLATAVTCGLCVALCILGLVNLHALVMQLLWLRPRSRPELATSPGDGEAWPLISVLIPAFNEERVIEATLRAVLAADYPRLQVIVVDDGSRDRTVQRVEAIARHNPCIELLARPQNEGKAAALNAGIAAARSRFLVVLDADTVCERDFLKLIVAPLLHGQADAVAGNVRVGNRPRRPLVATFQSIEYISVLNVTRLLQGLSNDITTIPGAAGAMLRQAVQTAGAYSSRTRAEDTDMTLCLTREGHRIVYQPRAIVRTEVPSTWRTLLHQRLRWIHGNMQCIAFHAWRSRRRWRFYGLPVFVYENVWKPPLELCRALTPLLVLVGAASPVALSGYLALALLNWSIVVLSYRIEQESPRELLLAPVQYAVWPFLIIFPYYLAIWHFLRRNQVPWRGSIHPIRAAASAATRPGGGSEPPHLRIAEAHLPASTKSAAESGE